MTWPRRAASSASQLLASEVWEELTDNERLVAGILDLPVREMAETAGLSRSTAQRAATGAREVLVASWPTSTTRSEWSWRSPKHPLHSGLVGRLGQIRHLFLRRRTDA